ncbi:putative peptidoglycan binding domain protein [Mycobacteroides abscessus 5S-0422]|uniref:Putative peptidoglycan binding domain protein n=2 Tax=Mycobacteroides abscessus TaxID=36809 RepID=X8DJ17_9MYCO|nr:peptidoglycan-binding protein [Mycobacteroides abscessus]EUA67460.1 putative peptidoglycan binding domain protein [Mycobacteroides abscessus subsp. bolletii 1513]EIU03965.1 putative peptidoglycan binding domain protein [Mycobacteroides abscessus 5S-0422]EIU09833.1 putative peptidoglycan binding domain protein [Mycobacteroides abscessus 5S-0304]EIU22655.1 putative peptidoglycan binding domain protein [Mycobacteroides abscessus 5S-0708]EIU31568.1 putative peptidoglycan binding domain protein 
MAWQQPQLADPPMGPTDEIRKLQHRLLFAYPGRSDAHNLGVIESGVFDPATDRALRNMQEYLAATEDGKYNSKPGVLTYDCKTRLGVVLAAPKAPAKRFVQQGVGFSTDAFLMGDPTHSYVDARTEGSTELLRLALPMVGVPKIWIGYSMGDDVVNTALLQWPEDRRDEIKLIIGFGGPSRRPGPTLLGNDPGGQGISGVFGPDWAASRTYQFTHKGDMYPNAVGLLPWLYQILTRMEISLDFAAYLFNLFISTVGKQLLGLLASALPGAGTLSTLAALVTTGPTNQVGGQILDVMKLFALLPQIIQTIAAALKFVQTNAHFHYHDQPQPFWRGLTAVDCAAQIIAEKVPNATVFTVPGTVSWWNDGPPAWTAWKLP